MLSRFDVMECKTGSECSFLWLISSFSECYGQMDSGYLLGLSVLLPLAVLQPEEPADWVKTGAPRLQLPQCALVLDEERAELSLPPILYCP